MHSGLSTTSRLTRLKKYTEYFEKMWTLPRRIVGEKKDIPVISAATIAGCPRIYNASTSTPIAKSLSLFGGTGHLAYAMAEANIYCELWDYIDGEDANLLLQKVHNKILHKVKYEADVVTIDFPCNTFSRARKNDGLGPPPLRDDNMFLKGRPGLSSKDIQKVEEANLLVNRTIEIIKTALANWKNCYAGEPIDEPLMAAQGTSGTNKPILTASSLIPTFVSMVYHGRSRHVSLYGTCQDFDYHNVQELTRVACLWSHTLSSLGKQMVIFEQN